MASTLNNTPARVGSARVARLIEANRARFDSANQSSGAIGQRIASLEAALAEARAEAAALRVLIERVETSTTWRVLRPVRWAVEAVRPKPIPPPPPALPPAPILPPLDYQAWIRSEEPRWKRTLAQPGPGHRPVAPSRLGLVLLGTEDGTDRLAGVTCPDGCRVLTLPQAIAPAEAVARALEQCEADWVCFLDARDRLAPDALVLAALVLSQYPQVDLLFADEDWLDAEGRRIDPFFKPGWSPELQRGRDLVGPFAFFRTDLVRQAVVANGTAWRYDLANQVVAATQPDRIRHVPAVLCHRTALPLGHAAAMREAAAEQLQRQGVAARVTSIPDHPEFQRVSYTLPCPEPLVSIVVPTRDRADLLRVCADGVLNQTSYSRLELVIVDNGTTDPAALALLETLAADARVQVVRCPGPFNWSALNNAAAARVVGDVLVLLNNDIAMLQPDWLTVLVSHAIQPEVGAAGAKLLYPDGRVQHAGLTTEELGVPLHLFRFAPGDAAGPFGLLAVARDVWGLTGACLALRRDVFFEVGGLNEALPVAYNDVDLCLRLTACGYRLVWTPWCLVEHREMASRPPDHAGVRLAQSREERERLLRDWGSLALLDPFLNPNLQLRDELPCLRRLS